jgi:acyl dehydratase
MSDSVENKSGQIYFEDVKEGDELPALVKGPIERIQLVRYAGASGDFNPIHVDEEYARSAGMKSVFAHGMLSMGFAGQLLTDWLGEEGELKRFKIRFRSIVWPGDVITNTGTIARKYEEDGKGMVDMEIVGKNHEGTVTVQGSATSILPRRTG